MCPSGANYYGRTPRDVGLTQSAGSTWVWRGLGKRLDYRKEANDSTRAKRSQPSAAPTSMVTPFSAILFLMRVWLAFIYPASEWGLWSPRLDENRCPTILISGTAFQPCRSSGLSSGRLAVHVICYPASQNQVGGARVTAGSGVHLGWPCIEFSVVCCDCPGDPRQLVGQRTDHEIGVMVGR